ncbi:hypothetical protein Ae201684P_002047 [Aphanomyces euteiches]|nr:hypothetical protein Ae201684P_002047 [Aphanomyces euteiches]
MVHVDILGDGLSDAVEHFASDNEDCGALKDKNAVKVPWRPSTNSRAMDIKDLYRRKTTPIDLQSLFDKEAKSEKPIRGEVRYARDQLEDLVATADHLYSAISQRSQNFRALQTARVGKPSKRYQSGTSLVSSTIPNPPQVPLSTFHRVQQVVWENSIIWGDEDEATQTFEAEEDDDGFSASSSMKPSKLPNVEVQCILDFRACPKMINRENKYL